MHVTPSTTYYRLIALWVLCEAMLGGIIHGLKIPISGLVVGSAAVVCVCLIAWYNPARGAIIKATVIVAIFKMMLSPQAPPTAYIAVFFQGLVGELLFANRKNYVLGCYALAILALLESGLQRILVLTIVAGNDFWKSVNVFINGITGQITRINYSLLLAGAYVALHLIVGLVVGRYASVLPQKINQWQKDDKFRLPLHPSESLEATLPYRQRSWMRKGLFIFWLILLGFYFQSTFRIGNPILPSHLAIRILTRSLIIILSWIFIVSPIIKTVLHYWLQKKKSTEQPEIQKVLTLLPSTQQVITQSWNRSSFSKGWRRILLFFKMILVNALTTEQGQAQVFILTGPIQTGKTNSIVNWLNGRKNVAGILTPVRDGSRYFMNADTKELFRMEANEEDKNVLTIGRFVFSKSNFEKAISTISEAIHQDGWLVIDEIGPLELKGEGFSDILKRVLAERNGKTLLVVRDKDGTLENVKEHFQMCNITVINSISELK